MKQLQTDIQDIETLNQKLTAKIVIYNRQNYEFEEVIERLKEENSSYKLDIQHLEYELKNRAK